MKPQAQKLRVFSLFCLGFSLTVSFILAGVSWRSVRSSPVEQEASPQPTPDRLEIPVLPPDPTQLDIGRSVYYYNCMPCHGDRGQGLTDEWRQVWVEDHQNCWDRGCHGGREEDGGFPIPKFVPAVSKLQHTLENFSTPDDLFAYLRLTHPPQNPGILPEEDYWAVTAFLLEENGRLPGKIDQLPVNQIQLKFDLTLVITLLAINALLANLLILQARVRDV